MEFSKGGFTMKQLLLQLVAQILVLPLQDHINESIMLLCREKISLETMSVFVIIREPNI